MKQDYQEALEDETLDESDVDWEFDEKVGSLIREIENDLIENYDFYKFENRGLVREIEPYNNENDENEDEDIELTGNIMIDWKPYVSFNNFIDTELNFDRYIEEAKFMIEEYESVVIFGGTSQTCTIKHYQSPELTVDID